MDAIERIYQEQSRRVLATLIRLLGDFVLAEEAMQEAFTAALHQWPGEGVPDNPAAWLIRIGQRRGIDQIRRKQTARQHAHLLEQPDDTQETLDEQSIEDDQLRLLFTCCHPSLSPDARIALTLREMCGLTTEQVARALLQKPATLAQRIVRAKRKIRQDRTLWDGDNIRSGLVWLEQALARTPAGPYTLQASIAATHAQAGVAEDTDWARIVRLYEALYRQQPSPVIALNRAVATAMRDTPADGLRLLDELASEKAIHTYHFFHAARADLYRRNGNVEQARSAYERALALSAQGPEQRFLQRRLDELTGQS